MGLNPYLSYKRDTSRLIYWIVQTSNEIISQSGVLPDDVPSTPNLSGQITVASLVPLCKLIAKHVSTTPPAILQLFRSVIDARTTSYQSFQSLVEERPDPDVEKSNATHLHFISVLAEAFDILGGTSLQDPAPPSSSYPEELEQVLFGNQFAVLDALGDGESGQDGPRPGEPDGQLHGAEGAKRGQKKGKTIGTDSYIFLQDRDGVLTDQLLAISSFIYEWATLRDELQTMWKQVAYGNLNSAIAAAVSNVAISVIERTATAMSVDLPGQESFEALVRHVTRGSLEDAQGAIRFSLRYYQDGKFLHKSPRPAQVDLREQLLLHAYDALFDFVSDFQKNRSGKPTKRMMKQINNWNPHLDLGRATNEERLAWRRSYTINWLYDLVNVFSSPVVERNTTEGEKRILEEVDWCLLAGEDRRVLGLGSFAGFVTRLAMQKEGSSFRSEILPHHVFQLQCMVDAMTISRGWSILALRGHVIATPPVGFRPRRDLDLFLDRTNENAPRGFLMGVHMLRGTMQVDWQDCEGCIREQEEGEGEEDEEDEEEMKRKLEEIQNKTHEDMTPLELKGHALSHSASIPALEKLHCEFANWLGESKYMHGLPGIPPSRFSNTETNGLWEYSPFLCGCGLAEALADAHRTSIDLLEQLPDAVLLLHLYNMIWQKQGDIMVRRGAGIYAELMRLFRANFFQDGVMPRSNFRQAMQARLDQGAVTNAGVPKNGSYIAALREAGWEPDRVPDKDIHIWSCFLDHRLSLLKPLIDPATGQKRLEETDLVRKCRSMGITDEDMVKRSTYVREALQNRARESSTASDNMQGRLRASASIGNNPNADHSNRTLLKMVRDALEEDMDFYDADSLPFSGINYLYVMVLIMTHWKRLEKELKDTEHPLHLEIYHIPQPGGGKGLRLSQQRLQFVSRVMETEDEACLTALAKALEKSETVAVLFMFAYWGVKTRAQFDSPRMKEKKKMKKKEKKAVPPAPADQCSVM